MQCNLGAPDGIRKGDEDGEEIGETEEDDRLRFKGCMPQRESNKTKISHFTCTVEIGYLRNILTSQ